MFLFDLNVRQWGTFHSGCVLLVASFVGYDPQKFSAKQQEIFIYRIRRGATAPRTHAALPYIDNRVAAFAQEQKRLPDKARLARLGVLARLGFYGGITHRVGTRSKCIRGEIRVESFTVNTQGVPPGTGF